MLRTSRPNHFAQPSRPRLGSALKASSAQKWRTDDCARYDGCGLPAAVLHLTHDPPGSFPSGTGVPEMATGALSRNQRGKSVTRIRAAHHLLTPDPKGSGR